MRATTLHNVQYLRILAAGSVLFSHAASLTIPFTSPLWSVPWTAGVDLFFVISGFIMAWLTDGQFGQRGAPLDYLLRRIVRIVPAYWFFTLLMIAAVWLVPAHVHHTRLSPAVVLTSVLFVPWPRGDGGLFPLLSQGWTLNFEAFFYVCFAVALFSRRGFALLIAAFAALAAVHALVPAEWFAARFYTSPIILEFAGGMLLARWYRRGVRLPPFAPLLGAAAAIVWFLLAQGAASSEAWGFGRVATFGIPALLLAGSVILSPDLELGKAGDVLTFGGDASYTIYLSHTFTINAVVVLLLAAGLRAPAVILAAAVGAALLAAAAFYRLVEAPVTRQLGRALRLDVRQMPASAAP